MSNELAVIEKLDLVPFFTKGEGTDDVLAQIAEQARAHVPDISTAKGRAAIKANVTFVTKSKTYLESKGKDLAAEYKAIPKRIDETRRKSKEFLQALQDEVRQKLTEWEDEQARIEAEKQAAIDAEKLAAQKESDHEIAVLIDEKLDRDAVEAAKIEADRIERERIAYESRIKEEAEKKAREDEQRKSREAYEKRIIKEHARIAAQELKDLEVKAQIDRANKAEADAKQAKIDAEDRAARAKADADLRVTQAAENERLRVKKEQEQSQREADERAADVNNRREKNNEILGALVSAGVSVSAAKLVITVIAKKQIPHAQINY